MNEEIFYDALRDRIKLLMVRKHVTSVNDWALNQLGMNQPTVDRMIKGQAKPSLEFLRRIMELYPDVSADWLLRGKEEAQETSPTRELSIELLRMDLEAAENKIRWQSEEIDKLNDLIIRKNKIIDEFIRSQNKAL
jgi:transcriptional regulator with XRE-family HTH domain